MRLSSDKMRGGSKARLTASIVKTGGVLNGGNIGAVGLGGLSVQSMQGKQDGLNRLRNGK